MSSNSFWHFITQPIPRPPFSDEEIKTRADEIKARKDQQSEVTDKVAKDIATKELTDEKIRAKAHELWSERLHKQRNSQKRTAEDDWNEAQETILNQSNWKLFLQWTGVKEKKLWDFMQLLLFPALLAIGGFWLNQQAAERQDSLSQQRRQQDQQLADDKAKQDTLVKYLDQMADSLKDGLLRAKPSTEKFIIAQARTVTVLQSLDRRRQQLVIQFLKASGLNKANENTGPNKSATQKALLYQAQMEKANLSNSDLSGAVLIQVNLRSANLGCNPPQSKDLRQCSDLSFANLSRANLSHTNLSNINFSNADLRYTNLDNANLSNANLGAADLEKAKLFYVNLSQAYLSCDISIWGDSSYCTNFKHADIYEANFSGADLSGAFLYGAKIFHADFSKANLIDAVLSYAVLYETNFSGANLSGAILDSCDLRKVNFSDAILLATDLSHAQGLTQHQLEGETMPLLCKVALPPRISVNPNRDCDRLPAVLHNRYPQEFKTIEDAKAFVDNPEDGIFLD